MGTTNNTTDPRPASGEHTAQKISVQTVNKYVTLLDGADDFC